MNNTIYIRPSFERMSKMTKMQREGEFAGEYHARHSFNEKGDIIASTDEQCFKILDEIPAYIEEQEALFQKEKAKIELATLEQ